MFSRTFPEELTEAGILFAVLFLPAYVSQSTRFDPAILYGVEYNLRYLIIAIPQVMLLLFSILRQRRNGAYGLKRPTPTQWASTALLAAMLFVVAIPIMYVRAAIEADSAPGEAVLPVAGLTLSSIMLLVCSAIATGYREELYFRSLLYVRLSAHGAGTYRAGIVATVLFAAGHVYQGAIAFAGALVMGGLLAFWFEKQRNIHVLALAHGAYNVCMLLAYRSTL